VGHARLLTKVLDAPEKPRTNARILIALSEGPYPYRDPELEVIGCRDCPSAVVLTTEFFLIIFLAVLTSWSSHIWEEEAASQLGCARNKVVFLASRRQHVETVLARIRSNIAGPAVGALLLGTLC